MLLLFLDSVSKETDGETWEDGGFCVNNSMEIKYLGTTTQLGLKKLLDER